MQCPLTSFSTFPFKNFLMSLKKLVRTPNNPLSQVANRLKEINFNTNVKVHQPPVTLIKYVEKSTNLIKYIQLNQMIITNSSPNNIVQLENGKIYQIVEIYSSDNNSSNINNIFVKGLLYQIEGILFEFPCKSSVIGLWKIVLSKRHKIFKITKIKHKCVLLKVENITYCIKLLHI